MIEEWKELRWSGRWGSVHSDLEAAQQIIITEDNVFLALRQKSFLSPRLHRVLCRLPTIQPAVYEKAREIASIHVLIGGIIAKPLTAFIISVPNGLEAKVCIRGKRDIKETINDQNRTLTAFVKQLVGTEEDQIYCAAQLFKYGRGGRPYDLYKLLHVTSDEKAALDSANEHWAEGREIWVLEITGDHDILKISMKKERNPFKPYTDVKAKLEKELTLLAIDAINSLKGELKTFTPDFEKCDGWLGVLKEAMQRSITIEKDYFSRYVALAANVEYRRAGLVTKADVTELKALLEEIRQFHLGKGEVK